MIDSYLRFGWLKKAAVFGPGYLVLSDRIVQKGTNWQLEPDNSEWPCRTLIPAWLVHHNQSGRRVVRKNMGENGA